MCVDPVRGQSLPAPASWPRRAAKDWRPSTARTTSADAGASPRLSHALLPACPPAREGVRVVEFCT